MEFLLLRRVLWRALSREPDLLEGSDPFVVQSRLDGAVDVLVVEFAVAFFDRATQALAEQARTDPLTGLLNHQAFWGDAASELERAARYRHELTLVYLDVDDFKGINDRHGHPAGDRVLRAVAAVLLDEARASDLVGRTGGDEFAACLVESEPDAGARFIARLRGRVAGLSLDRGIPPALSITPAPRASRPRRATRTPCSSSPTRASTRPSAPGSRPRSSGSGDSTSTRSPVNGCGNASRAACRNCRRRPGAGTP